MQSKKKGFHRYTNKKTNKMKKAANMNSKRIRKRSRKSNHKSIISSRKRVKGRKRFVKGGATDLTIPENLREHMLICPISGECMALGNKRDEIIDFFQFTDFRYAINITSIGAPSENGFVKEIKYERGEGDKYSSYAVLKSSLKPASDNLVYEYEVGMFVNKLCKRFPCFLQTYGLYYYKESKSTKGHYPGYLEMKQYNIDYDVFRFLHTELEKQQDIVIDYKKACQKSKYAAILIEHLSNSITLYQFIVNNRGKPDVYTEHLPNILFQIYFPLAQLAKEKSFVHYDLHMNNVMIYQLPENTFVEFEYTLDRPVNSVDDTVVDTNKVVFKTRFIAKIIDYGRSYYNDIESGKSSKKTYRDICSIRECIYDDSDDDSDDDDSDDDSDDDDSDDDHDYKKRCGHKHGFELFTFMKLKKIFNKRDDLLLFNECLQFERFKSNLVLTLGRNLLKKFNYNDRIRIPDEEQYPNSINTVIDAAQALAEYIHKGIPTPPDYSDNINIGTIKVHPNAPQIYIPNSSGDATM